ncbi:MAG: tRNA (adenosine(37)-N6)-threonylcarbamoyltransferase complex dimerization subunit type 1 TsaB [Desulfovibrionaceae bacterium]|nr:tRNA (adenosine(37)-N6)-threonylcarbamoyltransferase complex dimerization subunit type 1 TsaB [Desulfovibrionaceae bacterium]
MAEESPCLLVLNAAEGLLHIIIARQEADGAYTRLCAQSWHAPTQGAELLTPALDHALQRLCIAPHDIGRIAAVRGPGSFTGLRLVLATASGLARAIGALQAGLDYLPLLAASALYAIPAIAAFPRRVWVLTHARRNLIHMQGFIENRTQDVSGGPLSLRPLCDILVCSPEEAALYLTRLEAEQPAAPDKAASLVLGSGLTRNREGFVQALQAEAKKSASPPPLLLPSSFDHPSPEALQDAATNAVYGLVDPEPLYVRPADAIDNLEKIAASMGLDPEAAKKRFQELTGNGAEQG